MKRLLDEAALRSLARGCAVLGTGGGGDPRIGLLLALQALEEVGPTELVDLDDLPPEALIMPCGMVGAPTPAEIGGSNGLLPLTWAGRMGLPVVDADGMGRAFPLIPQVTMHLAGIDPNPGVMTDERGNVLVFSAISGEWMERLERSAAVEFGGAGAATEYVMTVAQARDGAAVRGTFTLAIEIGDALASAVGDPVSALVAVTGGYPLASGKVTDVERRTTKGFVRGSVEIEGLGDVAGRLLRLEIQNENLVALEHGTVLASVPDLI